MRLDFGAQDWYTRPHRACKKCLILLAFCDRRGSPSLRAKSCQERMNLQGIEGCMLLPPNWYTRVVHNESFDEPFLAASRQRLH